MSLESEKGVDTIMTEPILDYVTEKWGYTFNPNQPTEIHQNKGHCEGT